jgi:ABC-type branched-subunit amino acid transport system substrate-binding protein
LPNAFRLLSLALLALPMLSACAEHPQRVGDGWSYGRLAGDDRAFLESQIGFSSAEPPVELVGLGKLTDDPNLVAGVRGGVPGESWARALLERGPLSVVVGHRGSGATTGAARLYAEAGVPLIAPNATALTDPEVEAWIFRLLPTDDVQGRFLATYALDSLQANRVAVVFVGDAYGVGILRGVRAELSARGLPLADEVELPTMQCARDGPARFATRAMMKRARPDVVIVALSLTPADCVIDEITTGAPTTWVIGSDALDARQTDQWARSYVPLERIRLATGWAPREDSATTAFIEAFTAAFGHRPHGSEALLHDAFALAAAAVRQTGGNPKRVRNWLASLGTTQPAWPGLTGDIRFDQARPNRLYLRQIQ